LCNECKHSHGFGLSRNRQQKATSRSRMISGQLVGFT
jgi:hypothetical protein